MLEFTIALIGGTIALLLAAILGEFKTFNKTQKLHTDLYAKVVNYTIIGLDEHQRSLQGRATPNTSMSQHPSSASEHHFPDSEVFVHGPSRNA